MIESNLKYIYWLFPDVNTLSKEQIDILSTSQAVRKRITKLTIRMLDYGIRQIKQLPATFRMITFLQAIKMQKLSTLVFNVMQQDEAFQTFVKNENYFHLWRDVQQHMSQSSDSMECDVESDVEYEPWDEPELVAPSFRGLNYTKNSCYIDSVLLALLAIPNKIIDKNILDKNLRYVSKSKQKWINCGENDLHNRTRVQDELIRITNSMRGLEEVRDCTQLRKYLANCPGSQPFHRTGMQDAGEFLLYIFNIFQVGIMTKHRVTYVTNSLANPPENVLQTFEEFQVSTPVYNISSTRLRSKEPLDITTFLKDVEDAKLSAGNLYKHPDTGVKYKRRIEINRIVSASYVVFNAQRLSPNGSVSQTRITIPEKIEIEGKVLKLHAVIVHESHHYTCYIKCDKFWYHYDDMSHSGTKWIGDLSQCKHLPDPEKNGILYFYS
jgi:hypothetical protein